MSLSLFPARVPIGVTTDANGKSLLILMTPEFSRAWNALYEHVGGDSGTANDDLALLSGLQSTPDMAARAVEDLAISQAVQPVAQVADIAALRQRVEELAMQISSIGDVAGAVGTLRRDMEGAQIFGFTDPYRVPWDRPGAIGSIAASTGKFTILTSSGGATFLTTSAALANGAAAAAGTIANAPVAGNPSKWIGINDNGTIRYIPAW